MLKGQDVVLLLKLVGRAGDEPIRDLASSVGFDNAGTHRALQRLQVAGLCVAGDRRVMLAPAEEFLLHATRFNWPAELGAETRGVPTAWGAEPLRSRLADTGQLAPVWPHSEGEARGFSLKPLHAIVPDAALRDAALWERLALVDALRAGDARARELAGELLIESLRS